MKRLIFVSMLCINSITAVFAQFGACDCNASIGNGATVNFSAISWTGTGCPTSGTTAYTGNLCLSMANGSTINYDKASFTLTGDFKIVNGGTNVNFNIPANKTLHVTGDMGFTSNNNITYTIDGTLTVDGTLYSKNNGTLAGSGTLNAGGVDFGNGSTASSTLTYNVGSCSGNPAGFCTTVLPITLESFSSISKENAIQLDWATSSEINFDYFSLQRSVNGKDFAEIDQVKGHGTSNEHHKYQYIDHSPIIGKNYYRLTSVDFDNYQETFGVIVQEYSGAKEFHISPNPSDGLSVQLNFNFEAGRDGIVTIYDNHGSVVGSYPVNGESISFATILKPGLYLAKYFSSSMTTTDRFLVK